MLENDIFTFINFSESENLPITAFNTNRLLKYLYESALKNQDLFLKNLNTIIDLMTQ